MEKHHCFLVNIFAGISRDKETVSGRRYRTRRPARSLLPSSNSLAFLIVPTIKMRETSLFRFRTHARAK